MYTFFRKNQKFVMVIMVVLMVAFIIPTFFDRGRGMRDMPVGKIGDEQVLKGEVDHAADQWRYLLQNVYLMDFDQMGQQRPMPCVAVLAGSGAPDRYREALAGRLISQMNDNPELYYLLQLEARKMGLTPTLSEIDEQRIVVRTPDDRVVPIQDSTDEDVNNRARAFVANLLMVQRAALRAADAVKVSRPLLDLEVAARLQQIKCYVVDFLLSSYEDKVPTPTPEQLKQHFEKYADLLPDSPSESNPFGFGYKFPNRVKLQYVGVPRAEVARVVRASKPDAYDWTVEAHKYYDKHLAEFPATRPATTSTADALTLGPVAATGPTTKPFAEVQEQIVNQLIDAQVERLQPQIVAEIRNKLAADFETYRAANPKPATDASTGFTSFEYLQELAKLIEARHKVTITVATINDSFKTAEELRLLPGIGQVLGLADLATTMAEPFVPEDQRNRPEVLSPFEPSRPMSDMADNGYIFRITNAQPAHRPASLDEVLEKVAHDWKRTAAMELAKSDAQKLLEQAKTVGLRDAAEQAKLKLIMTGFYSAMPRVIADYSITSRSLQTFAEKTFALMAVLSNKNGTKPVGLVELPADARVAVAELIAIESRMKPEETAAAQAYFMQDMMFGARQEIGAQWFDLDSVIQRLGYEDYSGKHRPKPSQASAQ